MIRRAGCSSRAIILPRAKRRWSPERGIAARLRRPSPRSTARLAEERPPAREELIAEELRAADPALGRLTGRVDVEDILDVIFRDFCIGK